MESDKPALEQVALDMVELYGRDAPKMLLERAEIADEYGELSWTPVVRQPEPSSKV